MILENSNTKIANNTQKLEKVALNLKTISLK